VLDEAIIASHGDLPLHLPVRIVIRRVLKFHLCRITRKNRQGRHPALLNKWIVGYSMINGLNFPQKATASFEQAHIWECTIIRRLLERWCRGSGRRLSRTALYFAARMWHFRSRSGSRRSLKWFSVGTNQKCHY
jgi:hypothetical protein